MKPITWLLCVRGDEEMDELSLYGIIWCVVMKQGYFEGQNGKWLTTILNPESNITRPAQWP